MEDQEREQSIGKCDKCGVEFGYYLVHNGFNDSNYAYCDKCGKVAFLNLHERDRIFGHNKRFFTFIPQGIIGKDMETVIKQCSCGGTFKHDASPRCPLCKNQLSAIAAKEYIEKNALANWPKNKKRWKWQNNWDDLYAIVIENNVVRDNWKT